MIDHVLTARLLRRSLFKIRTKNKFKLWYYINMFQFEETNQLYFNLDFLEHLLTDCYAVTALLKIRRIKNEKNIQTLSLL